MTTDTDIIIALARKLEAENTRLRAGQGTWPEGDSPAGEQVPRVRVRRYDRRERGVMGELAEKIAREHQRVYNRPHATCLCGWDRTYTGDQKPYLRHIAELTEQAVREQLTQELLAERDIARQAHQSAETDHLAHDYCRWVGHAEALTAAAATITQEKRSNDQPSFRPSGR